MKTKNLDLLLIFAGFMILSYVLMMQVALNTNVNLQVGKLVVGLSFFVFFFFLFREVNKRKKENQLIPTQDQKQLETKSRSRLASALIVLGVISLLSSIALFMIESSGLSEFIVGLCGILSGYLMKRNIKNI